MSIAHFERFVQPLVKVVPCGQLLLIEPGSTSGCRSALRHDGPTFGDVAREWWALIEAGTYARRRGRSKKLSDRTAADYRAVVFGRPEQPPKPGDPGSLVLIDRCGRRSIASLDDAYWQSIVEELVRTGKSYSRIATYLAVIRHVYAYARRPNRRLVASDPTRGLEMPANDGKVRERVATAEEAAKLIEALPAVDTAGALSWEAVLEIRASGESAVALARRFGCSDALIGKVRRGELGRAQWPQVFWDADEIMVAASKSDAGEGAAGADGRTAEEDLREEWMRQGRPQTGRIVIRSGAVGQVASARR